jgi:hypothetical protein
MSKCFACKYYSKDLFKFLLLPDLTLLKRAKALVWSLVMPFPSCIHLPSTKHPVATPMQSSLDRGGVGEGGVSLSVAWESAGSSISLTLYEKKGSPKL